MAFPARTFRLVAFALIALAAFVLLSADVVYRGALFGLDEPALAFLRAHEPWVLLYAAAAVSQLGSVYLVGPLGVVVGVILIRRRRWRMLGPWLLGLLGSAGINGTLKAFFARPRPYHVTAFPLPAGYTYPSGHTMGATIGFGLLAVLIGRRYPRYRRIALLMAVGISLAEATALVLVRVHYPTDVLGGLTLGWAWVACCALLLGQEPSRAQALPSADPGSATELPRRQEA